MNKSRYISVSVLFVYVLFFICLFFPSGVLRAEYEDLEQWGLFFEKFYRPEIFISSYREVKYIPALQRPLRSSGTFVYIRETGLAWFMERPFEMNTTINDQGLSQRLSGVKQPMSKDVNDIISPIIKNISAIFSGDFKLLSTHFTLDELSTDEEFWNVALIPKDTFLKPYLKVIEISGSRYINIIKIVYTENKYTIVTYDEPKIGMKYITRAHRNVFDQ